MEKPLGLELETDVFLWASIGKWGYNLSPFSVWDLSSHPCVEQESLTDSFISSSVLGETATQLWVLLAFQLLGTERGCPPVLAWANCPYLPEASALETFLFCFLLG